jgi:hypothetical protein
VYGEVDILLYRAVRLPAQDGVEEVVGMKTVIIYESLYGNTRRVAEELARVARGQGDVDMVGVDEATPDVTEGADLVLIGGPTHIHGLSWKATREGGAADAVGDADRAPGIDAAGPGLRDWFHRVGRVDGTPAAAFDTRFDGPEVLTGRASLGISRRLRHHGFAEVAAPKSFVVDKENTLLDGEIARARQWALSVLESLLADAAH